MSSDRLFRIGLVAAIALGVVSVGKCALDVWQSQPKSVQMIPSPVATASPEVRAASKGESASQTTGTQGIRIVGRPVRAPAVNTLKSSNHAESSDSRATQVNAPDGDSWEWVIEASQSIFAIATSSAQSSASISPDEAAILAQAERNARDAVEMTRRGLATHGRLGVAAITMPGILAADLQLLALDASNLTRWLVDVDMEVGLDAAANTEAGALGVTAGSKAFVGVYYWTRWNLSAQGPALAIGLRF